MTLAIISHPDCLLHDMGGGHPEQPARIKVIMDAIQSSTLTYQTTLAPLISDDQLFRIHPQSYVTFLERMQPSHGIVPLDPDTFLTPFTLNATRRAAGAVINAVDLVMQNKINTAFCNIRPPGHHAESALAMGFCFFNNVALGVAHALNQYQLARVAIIDFDVHHGNGTEQIFQNDERVLLCSVFQYPFYPNTAFNQDNPHILNLPLPAHTSGKIWRDRIQQNWLDKILQIKPEIIFFSAGFDGYKTEQIANFRLDIDDYVWLTSTIRQIAQALGHQRFISVLEGGYELTTLGQCVVAHLQALSTLSAIT